MEVSIRTNLKKIGFENTLQFLKSMNCCYKIIDADNNLYTNIPDAEVFPESRRSKRKYPHGTFANYFRKHLGSVKPGEITVLLPGDFEPKHVYKVSTAYMNAHWGAGSYTTHITPEGLEILRIR